MYRCVGIDYYNSSAVDIVGTLELSLNWVLIYFQESHLIDGTRARTHSALSATVSQTRTFTKVLLVTFRPPQRREGHTDNDGDEFRSYSADLFCSQHPLPRSKNVLLFTSLASKCETRDDYHWKIWSTDERNPKREHVLRRSTAVMGKTRTRSYDTEN